MNMNITNVTNNLFWEDLELQALDESLAEAESIGSVEEFIYEHGALLSALQAEIVGAYSYLQNMENAPKGSPEWNIFHSAAGQALWNHLNEKLSGGLSLYQAAEQNDLSDLAQDIITDETKGSKSLDALALKFLHEFPAPPSIEKVTSNLSDNHSDAQLMAEFLEKFEAFFQQMTQPGFKITPQFIADFANEYKILCGVFTYVSGDWKGSPSDLDQMWSVFVDGVLKTSVNLSLMFQEYLYDGNPQPLTDYLTQLAQNPKQIQAFIDCTEKAINEFLNYKGINPSHK